jgi:hypothetical protein
MTRFGLATWAAPEDEVLIVVARRTQGSLIVHARHVAVVTGGGAWRQADRGTRYRNGAK